MQEKVRIAVVGCGAIGRVQARELVKLSDCELTALCNRHPEKAKALAEELNLDLPVFDDPGELFAAGLCDAVTICLAPEQHCAVTCQALSAGLHVMVEKPMARSLAECDAMLEAARRNGKTLAVICQNRYRSPAQRLKQVLKSGFLGPLTRAEVSSLWWRGENYYDPAWRGTWQIEGGGCLMSHAVHQLDMTLWLLGRPLSVTASMYNRAHHNSECEDEVYALLDYGDFTVLFTCSLNHHAEKQDLVFDGLNGTLSFTGMAYVSKALPNGYPAEDKEAIRALKETLAAAPVLSSEGHGAQLQTFIEALLQGRKPEGCGEEGRDALELLMALYKAAVTGKKVSLPLSPDDPFYRHETRVPLMPVFHQKRVSVEGSPVMEISLGSGT